MKELSEIDVYYCKLQGVVHRLNLLRKLHRFSWKDAIKRFSDFLSTDKIFKDDVDLVKRFRNLYETECRMDDERVHYSFFANYLFYLNSRKLFHDYDIAFLKRSVVDFSIFVNFLQDYGKDEKK